MASHSNAGSSSTRPETNVSETPNQKNLPNGLQKSDTTDAVASSDLVDEDLDPSKLCSL